MRYFNYQEFEDSATARRDGIDNSLTPVAQQMVTILVEMLLDPLRRVWGRPIVISSGYRCPELNILIGGSQAQSPPPRLRRRPDSRLSR